MSTMRLRDAVAGDLADVARAVADQSLMRRYGTTPEALERNLVGALARGEDVVLAEDSGAVVGMAWCLRTGTFVFGGYLRLISVYPGCEGMGIGALLLAEVERRVSTVSGTLFLLVSDFNDGARRFYAGRGYAEVGELPGLVKADVSEIVMWKKLQK